MSVGIFIFHQTGCILPFRAISASVACTAAHYKVKGGLGRHGGQARGCPAQDTQMQSVIIRRKMSQLSRSERTALVSMLTGYELKCSCFQLVLALRASSQCLHCPLCLQWSSHEGYKKAEVTGGGVPLSQVCAWLYIASFKSLPGTLEGTGKGCLDLPFSKIGSTYLELVVLGLGNQAVYLQLEDCFTLLSLPTIATADQLCDHGEQGASWRVSRRR
eukprot:scaffold30023_cov16-Tisochrysis_lutea.AAC.1